MVFPTYEAIRMPLLTVLVAAGGRLPAKDAIAQVASHFPELTSEDLQTAQPSGSDLKWRNMVRWARQYLVGTGAIDGSVRGIWTITNAGRAMVTAGEQGEPPPDAARPRRPTTLRNVTEPSRRPSGQGAELAEVLPPAQDLYQRLRAAAHSGTEATVFEEALADVFRFLGFTAVQIGGRGDTDVLVRAPLGKDTYVAVVDAKSSRAGKVPDTALNFASLRLLGLRHHFTTATPVSHTNPQRYPEEQRPGDPGG